LILDNAAEMLKVVVIFSAVNGQPAFYAAMFNWIDDPNAVQVALQHVVTLLVAAVISTIYELN
jgi:hypothetical protein